MIKIYTQKYIENHIFVLFLAAFECIALQRFSVLSHFAQLELSVWKNESASDLKFLHTSYQSI
jgi:hypothetical protein